ERKSAQGEFKMPPRRFPNLFIIGAMKAGTSSLHEYLHQHPQIFMSRFKEPQYFAPHSTRGGLRWGQGNPCPEPGIDWYLRLFADAGDVMYAGESSVSYTAAPWVTGCEKRIHAFNPDAKLIYLLRDPIERTISHYWHMVADGREDLDLMAAVRCKEEYLARSDYAGQLCPYLDTFGRDQLFVLTIEELMARPNEIFGQLFSWLGVAPDFPIKCDQKFNVGSLRVRQTRRGLVRLDTLQKGWRWKKYQQYLPSAAGTLVERLTYRIVDRSAADTQAAAAYLRPIQQRQTDALSQLLNREFPEWTTLGGAVRHAAETKLQPGAA
ncbi:MAG TPA: sulfotransferase, partial [Pirellulales bacterium]|nr:sulfotransferase [Pirellulales bacterium]